MFRKPKKKPTALRGGTGGGGGASVNSGGANNNQSKKRRRQNYDSSSSDDEEDEHNNTNNNDNDTTTTSELLEQIRQERSTDKTTAANKSKKPLLNTASTNNNTSKKTGGGMMHQFKSNNHEIQLSAKDMATRTAEYHPTNNDNVGSNSNSTTINNNNETNDKDKNATLPSLQKQPRNKFLAGPLKATTFVRTTARFDYQPDICKDYKETGFCGFGDTCIYLHDRGDTKSGWEMEQEYEGKKKAEEERRGREMERFMKSMMCGEVGADAGGGGVKGETNLDDDDKKDSITDDGIPFACHICRGPFRNPVVTTCWHYFCESCMQSRIRGDDTNDGGGGGTTGCPICQKDTHGVLNHPQKLVAKKRRLVGRDGTWEDYLNKK